MNNTEHVCSVLEFLVRIPKIPISNLSLQLFVDYIYHATVCDAFLVVHVDGVKRCL
jgi:hypothetical protein